MSRATVGLAIVAALIAACASDGTLELEAFEVGDGVVLYSNDERQFSYDEWVTNVHFALPDVEVPDGLALVNAYSYRPDADLDLSLVSLFFEDAGDRQRWLLVKFDDRASFPVRAPGPTVADLGAVEGRAGVYVTGNGEPWHDLAFEACGLGVAVKGHADVWSRDEIVAVARAIAEGCPDPRRPTGD